MKLTLHKSQVHSYSVMQWWTCSSLMSPPLPAEVGCESHERIAQARRQDLAAGRAKARRESTFLKYSIGRMQQPMGQTWNGGAPISNGGPGTTGPPLETALGLLYCWSSLRNNNMATNLQKFTLYYGSRRFVAWNCWTYTSSQLMQRYRDMLIVVSHVHLYFVKRNMNESIAIFPQVWKIHLLVRVWPMCPSVKLHLCRLLFMEIKLRGFLECIYAGLWEYVLIVKV